MAMFAALLAAASLGATLFFSAVIAPSVFQALDEKQAGQFLRLTFPKYFAVNGFIALLAALAAFQPVASGVLLVCAVAMFAVRQFAIPVINEARDAAVAGTPGRSANSTGGIVRRLLSTLWRWPCSPARSIFW
jgi:hypothetical protein